MAKESNLVPFKKGLDERRNLNGAPKKLQHLDAILAEELGSNNTDESEAVLIIRSLVIQAKKGNVRAAEVLLDRAFGKVDQKTHSKIEITGINLNDLVSFK